MTKAAAKTELPKYVGYAEIAEATGIDKRQLQRLMACGKFPKPDGLPTKENRWRLSVVSAWLEQRNSEQIAALGDLAVTDPAKLKPEQVGDAIQALGARLAALHGDQVAPDDIVGVTRKLTDEEVAALQRNAAQTGAAEFKHYCEAFARLDPIRAWIVVAGLMPSLRPATDCFLETMTQVEVTQSQEELRALAIDILAQSLSGEFVGPSPTLLAEKGTASRK